MIRVNLIAVANDRNVSSAAIVRPQFSSSATPAKKKKTFMTALAAAAFVVVACSCYVVVFGVPSFLSGAIPEAALDAAGISHEGSAKAGSLAAKRAAIAEAKAKAARTLPVIVDEVQPAMFADKNAKRTVYKDYYPLEKMQYQKIALGQLMSFLQTATPENTGFTEVVYEAPNYYFIHGTTDAPVSQRAFIERLRAVSLDFKSPKVSKEDDNITEITAFGTLRADVQFKPEVKQFIGADSVNAEIAKLKKLDGLDKISFNGFEKPVKVENFGVYKRYTFNVRVLSNFVQLNAFIAAWKASDVRMGISRATFARSGKDVSASFTVDMFVTP